MTTGREERPSRSQLKRDMRSLRQLGQQLVDLPRVDIDRLSLSETLLDAVLAAKTFRREALRRQLLFIEAILRDEDVDAIRQALSKVARSRKAEVHALHEVEQWRDALIAGDNSLLDELVIRFENADRQHLRQLIRNANKEREHARPPKYARMLYQYLFDLRSGC